MKSLFFRQFVYLVVLFACTTVRAELLVYDPFDYTGGMNGADGTSEVGFDAAAWGATVTSMASATGAAGAQPNMAFGTGDYVLRSGGNSTRFTITNDGTTTGEALWYRGLSASLGAGSDLWQVYLFRTHDDMTVNAGRAIRTNIENTGNAIEFLAKRNGVAASSVRINGAGNPSGDLTGGRLTDTETYLVITKYRLNTSGNPSRADAWVLSEANFDEVAEDGAISEAELNALAGIHASHSSTGDGSLDGDALLDATDRFSFRHNHNAANITLDVSYDELRLADTLTDAVPIIPRTEIVSDTFDDNDYLVNKTGTGLGFADVGNNVNGTGNRVESGGQLTITTTGANNNSGVGSKVPLGATEADGVRIVWDVASAADWKLNGIEFLVQGGTGFRAQDYLQLRLDQNSGTVKVAANGTQLQDFGAYAGVADGFKITLTASKNEWRYDFEGMTAGGGTTAVGTSYGALSFYAIFNGGIVAATIQGQTPAAVLVLNEITADLIPPPAGTLFMIR